MKQKEPWEIESERVTALFKECARKSYEVCIHGGDPYTCKRCNKERV